MLLLNISIRLIVSKMYDAYIGDILYKFLFLNVIESKLWRPSLICLAIEICLILVLIFWYIAVGVVVARQPGESKSLSLLKES